MGGTLCADGHLFGTSVHYVRRWGAAALFQLASFILTCAQKLRLDQVDGG
jgi:hypothetical protein